MESSNQYPSPKLDAYEKALDGIDLCMKQNNSLNEKTDTTYQGFQQVRKQKSEFSVSGLWRKKRNIGQLKSNHAT
jgi:hypothetical protein